MDVDALWELSPVPSESMIYKFLLSTLSCSLNIHCGQTFRVVFRFILPDFIFFFCILLYCQISFTMKWILRFLLMQRQVLAF